MRRILVTLLVWLSLAFPVSRDSKFYFIIRSIFALGYKSVFLFRSSIDSLGNIKTRMTRKRRDREYILSTIGELKETSIQLTESINTLSLDVAELSRMHLEVLSQLKNINRLQEFLPDPKEVRKEENKYYALLDSLKTSNDRLEKELSILSDKVKGIN